MAPAKQLSAREEAINFYRRGLLKGAAKTRLARAYNLVSQSCRARAAIIRGQLGDIAVTFEKAKQASSWRPSCALLARRTTGALFFAMAWRRNRRMAKY